MEIASIKNLPEEKVEQLLSVVVAGGGPTGVEMASVVSSYMNDEVVSILKLILLSLLNTPK